MDNVNIEGVLLIPQKIIAHPLGDVLHCMKSGEPGFTGFGEAYFSTIIAQSIKAWKKHLRMTLNIIVPFGEILFVMYDDRSESSTKGNYFSIKLSKNNYQRLSVPPGIWMGFQGIGNSENLLLNIADLKHDPHEIIRTEIERFPYDW